MEGPFARVRVVEEDEAYVVRVSGELDLEVVDAVTTAVLTVRASGRWPDQPLILDLADVSFVDSEGLRALLVARQLESGTGRTVVLRDPSEAVVATLALAGLTGAFVVEWTGGSATS